MLFKIPVKPRSEVLTTSQNLNPLRFTNPEYTHWVATTAAQTHTLPTPSSNLAGYVMALINDSSGSVTFSGTFVSGASITLTTKQSILIMCMPLSGTTHKWVKMGELGSSTELSADELAAVQGAASPGALNVFATMDDIVAAELTSDELAAVQGAATPSALNVFATMADAPSSDELAAIQGATTPSASNVFATMNDVDTPTPAGLGDAINTCSAKTTPVDADLFVVSDSADSNVAKKSTLAQVRSQLLTADALGGVIAGLTAKTSPIDADSIAICDSAATNDAKETTIAELRAVMLASDGLGTGLAALDAKATPIDADSLVVVDSVDTNNAKETTIAELRAVMLASDGLGTGIAALDAKATPIDADSIIVCDSADTNNAKETTIAELKAVILSANNLGGAIAGMAAKASPIAADSIVICDSADTNDAKETTIAELGAALLAADPLGTAIAALDAKATPIGADSIVVVDSADTNNAKETTITQLTSVVLGTALSGSTNWQDFAPTIASSPAQDSLVARYQRVGNTIHFYIDVRGSDGDAWTPSTITLPVTPSDVNAHIPLNAIQMHNTSTYLNPLAYVDAETSTYPIKFRAAAAATDTAPWSLHISGSYEVAAA